MKPLRSMMLITLGTMAFGGALGGCASEVDEEAWQDVPLDLAADLPEEEALDYEDKLINGSFTFDRPEIGSIRVGGGFCTATLIRTNVIVTAAHCVDYQTRQGGQLGEFNIDLGAGNKQSFPIDAYISYSRSGVNSNDIALARLSRPVPSNVARPTTIASRTPNQGDLVSWYGYGCGRRNSQNDPNTFRKQRLVFNLQQSDNSCPGDSGGPTVVGNDGGVFRVTSGYAIPGGDIFGDLVARVGQLNGQADEWSRGFDQGNDQGGDQGGGNQGGNQGGGNTPPRADGTRPVIKRTELVDRWAYLEWSPVNGVNDYTQFVVVDDGNGGVGTYVHRRAAPRNHPNNNNVYAYFDLYDVCRAARQKGLGVGPHRLWAQIWPGGDNTKAENGAFVQRVRCR
ncbi:MAG: trypsin-like serine protease [Bradymonadia bacterium]